MNESTVDEQLTDTVGLVSHETRARILIELAKRHRNSPREPTMGFTELRNQVGHTDPGNFNYHLKRLTGVVVHKTDAGYELSDIGHRLVGVLLSERFDPGVELSVDAEVSCPVCERRAAVSYDQGTVRADCDNGHSLRGDVGYRVLAENGVDTALNVAVSTGRFQTRLAVDGLCYNCDGPMSGGLEQTGAGDPAVAFVATCERCGALVQNTAAGCVLGHPAVVAICYEHDIDPRTDAWTLLTDHVDPPTVSGRDPLRVDVTVAVEDETVTLVLGADGTVVSVDER